MQKSQLLFLLRIRLVFRHCSLTALLMLTTHTAHAEWLDWHRNELHLLRGWNYELGEAERTIITYEHVSDWKYGFNNFFFDFLDPIQDTSETYFEGYTWLSYEKIRGQDVKWGIVDDVAFAVGFNADDGGFRAYRAGPTVIFDIPQLDFFSIDFFAFDDWNNPQVTYTITPFWDHNFDMGRFRFKARGSVTFTGKEGETARQVNAIPQLLLDIGHFWGHPDKFYAGVKYLYNRNKFGVKGVDESLPQVMLMWHLE